MILPGSAIPQFVQPLPLLNLACAGATCAAPGGINTVLGNQPLTLRMCEFQAAVLPPGTLPGVLQPLTWVWGYLVDPDPANNTCATLVPQYANPLTGAVDSYIGPVIVNDRGRGSTDVTWVNELGDSRTTRVLAYQYSTDQTLHWADPLAMQADGMSNMCMMLVEMNMFVNEVTGLPQDYPPPGHWCAQNYEGPIAAAPHLHGGEQPAEIDGSPDSWWTSDGAHFGHKFHSFAGAAVPPNAAVYRYPNDQEPAPIWFHDHTLGATRLNVYAGLAGAYYIQDPALIPVSAGGTCTASCLPANLQPLTEVVPLVLQDRMFDTNGQLFFTAGSAGGILWALNPEHPYWNPEFVGDTIVVNGKAWPFLNVARKRYRFLFLNGSNARTYEMSLVDPVTKVKGPPMWVIATDGGYLDAPARIDPNAAKPAPTSLVIQPGERYEVIVDFGDPAWLASNPNFSGTLILKNTGRTPYPKGAAPAGATLGQMMKLVVAPGAVTDASYDPAGGTPLRSGGNVVQRLVNPATGTLAPGVKVAGTRLLTLNEVMGMAMMATDPVTGTPNTAYPGGPLEVLVNNTKWGGKSYGLSRPDFTPSTVNGTTTEFSELPVEGDTEIWEIVNLTADAHPIHLHLVQFQILNRQSFNVTRYGGAYAAAFGTNLAVPLPPGCAAGLYCPAYGPPLDYAPSVASGNKHGGNPDVAPYLQGPVQPPLPSEAGWKDTAINYPGTVTRYAVRWAPNALPVGTPAAQLHFPFDPSGGAAGPAQTGSYSYVWHCHI
ncbi:MAG TPA: multicopper oxidase domain-containing protein, partial [Anaeromyxobacteraceae bacterium]|nr:multicopper oxidase domain-containing protein [Anaeromyxobacteraceae bacterium]